MDNTLFRFNFNHSSQVVPIMLSVSIACHNGSNIFAGQALEPVGKLCIKWENFTDKRERQAIKEDKEIAVHIPER